MCTRLAKSEDIFTKYALPCISLLVNDKIVSVRISLALLIVEIYKSTILNRN